MQERAVLHLRQGGDLRASFPEVVEALEGLPIGTVVDGGLCAYIGPPHGLRRPGAPPRPQPREAAYVVFDMLATTGKDLRRRPLAERWERLTALLEEPRPSLQRVLATRSRAEAVEWLEAMHPMGVEGIVAKGLHMPYDARAARWVKVRHVETLDVPLVAVVGHAARPEAVIGRMPDGATVQTNKLDSRDRQRVGSAVAGLLADPDRFRRHRLTGEVIVEVVTETGRYASVRFVRVRSDLE